MRRSGRLQPSCTSTASIAWIHRHSRLPAKLPPHGVCVGAALRGDLLHRRRARVPLDQQIDLMAQCSGTAQRLRDQVLRAKARLRAQQQGRLADGAGRAQRALNVVFALAGAVRAARAQVQFQAVAASAQVQGDGAVANDPGVGVGHAFFVGVALLHHEGVDGYGHLALPAPGTSDRPWRASRWLEQPPNQRQATMAAQIVGQLLDNKIHRVRHLCFIAPAGCNADQVQMLDSHGDLPSPLRRGHGFRLLNLTPLAIYKACNESLNAGGMHLISNTVVACTLTEAPFLFVRTTVMVIPLFATDFDLHKQHMNGGSSLQNFWHRIAQTNPANFSLHICVGHPLHLQPTGIPDRNSRYNELTKHSVTSRQLRYLNFAPKIHKMIFIYLFVSIYTTRKLL